MQFKDFKEASNSNKPFYQLFYYDRRHGYSDRKLDMYFSTEKELNETVESMLKENDKLYDMVYDVYGSYGLTPDKLYDNWFWNNISSKVDFSKLTPMERNLFRFEKSRVGYCHIRWFYRDLEAEREEEMNQEYEDVGPYGGAFSDWDDFWRWKER